MGTAEADSVYLSMLGSPEGIDTLRCPRVQIRIATPNTPDLKVVNGQPLLSYAVSDQLPKPLCDLFRLCFEEETRLSIAKIQLDD
jgi:hypothetical protein